MHDVLFKMLGAVGIGVGVLFVCSILVLLRAVRLINKVEKEMRREI